jgi:hypothetical protein
MATSETTSAAKAPTAVAIEQAGILFEQIASLAATLDRECYYAHGEQVEDREPERVQQELDRLREAINRIGWMADTGCEKIGGATVRGSAEEWLLPPSYKLEAARHG